jgi:hypothetical protein
MTDQEASRIASLENSALDDIDASPQCKSPNPFATLDVYIS